MVWSSGLQFQAAPWIGKSSADKPWPSVIATLPEDASAAVGLERIAEALRRSFSTQGSAVEKCEEGSNTAARAYVLRTGSTPEPTSTSSKAAVTSSLKALHSRLLLVSVSYLIVVESCPHVSVVSFRVCLSGRSLCVDAERSEHVID